MSLATGQQRTWDTPEIVGATLNDDATHVLARFRHSLVRLDPTTKAPRVPQRAAEQPVYGAQKAKRSALVAGPVTYLDVSEIDPKEAARQCVWCQRRIVHQDLAGGHEQRALVLPKAGAGDRGAGKRNLAVDRAIRIVATDFAARHQRKPDAAIRVEDQTLGETVLRADGSKQSLVLKPAGGLDLESEDSTFMVSLTNTCCRPATTPDGA